MFLVAGVVFWAAVWGLFQLPKTQRKGVLLAIAVLSIGMLAFASAGPIFGHYVDDPLGSGLIVMSFIGCLVAWFVYAVALAIARKRASSEQAFNAVRRKIRTFFLLYGGTYVAISLVVRIAIFLYLIREDHAWEVAGLFALVVPKWPFYMVAIVAYHVIRRRKAATAPAR